MKLCLIKGEEKQETERIKKNRHVSQWRIVEKEKAKERQKHKDTDTEKTKWKKVREKAQEGKAEIKQG